MKISTILGHIDSGHMALPEFQRGYVWNHDPVAALLNERADILALANGVGLRCFTSSADFRAYVETEILHLEAA